MSEFSKRYKLGEKLGEGAYSVVKKASDLAEKKDVAVKCIQKANLSPNDITELKHEVAILSEIDHPNLLKLHGFYEDEKYYYLVTEFVAGGELFDRIVEKEFYNEHDAQSVMRTLGSAIKYLHERTIVHRDLKPENILLTTKGEDATLKIADFGFAKKVGAAGLKTSLGTPGYVAPEILMGAAYDASVDMWAIGVILYILLCGYPPFFDENQQNLFKKIRAGSYAFDEPYWNSVSAGAKDLITHLLVVDPKKRYTIHDFLKHPWVVDESSAEDLTPAIAELRHYLNRRRMKAGVHAVQAMNKMKISAMTKLPTTESSASSDSLLSATSEKSASSTTTTTAATAAAPAAAATAAPAAASSSAATAAKAPAAAAAKKT